MGILFVVVVGIAAHFLRRGNNHRWVEETSEWMPHETPPEGAFATVEVLAAGRMVDAIEGEGI